MEKQRKYHAIMLTKIQKWYTIIVDKKKKLIR